jgi:hypothetical protein
MNKHPFTPKSAFEFSKNYDVERHSITGALLRQASYCLAYLKACVEDGTKPVPDQKQLLETVQQSIRKALGEQQ